MTFSRSGLRKPLEGCGHASVAQGAGVHTHHGTIHVWRPSYYCSVVRYRCDWEQQHRWREIHECSMLAISGKDLGGGCLERQRLGTLALSAASLKRFHYLVKHIVGMGLCVVVEHPLLAHLSGISNRQCAHVLCRNTTHQFYRFWIILEIGKVSFVPLVARCGALLATANIDMVFWKARTLLSGLLDCFHSFVADLLIHT